MGNWGVPLKTNRDQRPGAGNKSQCGRLRCSLCKGPEDRTKLAFPVFSENAMGWTSDPRG